VIGGPATGW